MMRGSFYLRQTAARDSPARKIKANEVSIEIPPEIRRKADAFCDIKSQKSSAFTSGLGFPRENFIPYD